MITQTTTKGIAERCERVAETLHQYAASWEMLLWLRDNKLLCSEYNDEQLAELAHDYAIHYSNESAKVAFEAIRGRK